MSNWTKSLRDHQARWLAARGATLDARGYATRVTDNLFKLGDATRAEIAGGSGKEIGTAERPGKLAAPWSSCALAVNVFEHWRGRDLQPLRAALGVEVPIRRLRFEGKFSTGFSAAAANLDVVLQSDGPEMVAIESKFLEPFSGSNSATKRIRPTYLKKENIDRWCGLHQLRQIATQIPDGRRFQRLDATQLMKHAIALRRTRQPFVLMHLWYSPPGEHRDASLMEHEVQVFRDAAQADGLRFLSMTHQTLFERFRAVTPDQSEYVDYLQGRYNQR